MPASSWRRALGVLALVGVYLVLGVLAAVCPSDATAQTHTHQHGKALPGHAVHSPLCAWACQANLQTGLVASPLSVGLLLVAVGSLVGDATAGLFRFNRFVPARAPPC